MPATSFATPRILTRGDTTQFNVGFFADDAETTPLIPVTPDYPSYTIIDPTGTPIQTGIGVMATAGNYTLQFLVPKDAVLSYFNQTPQQFNDKNQGEPLTANGSRYRIEWMMVTAENFQVNFVEEFDVRDVAITQSRNRELKYLTLTGDAVRLMYRVTDIPYITRLRLLIRGQDNNPIMEDYLDNSTTPPTGGLKTAQDGDSYVIYYDLPVGVTCANTAYIALWNTQETQFTPATTEYQTLTSITTGLLPILTSLRMLIDRFQKRLGRIVAYEDSDLLEYIARGLQMVNNQYPTTSYQITYMPDQLLAFVLLGAGWWGLKAQGILNAEMNINFSGQSVTLSLEAQAGIDSAAAAMMEMFNTGLAAAKMTFVRQARGMGTVSVRGYGTRAMTDMVFPISHSKGSGVEGFSMLFSKLGLL